MALVTCKECSSPVSTQAAACPHCGAPVAKPAPPVDRPRSLLLWVGVPMLLLAIGSAVVSDYSKKREAAKKAENMRIADKGLQASMSPAEFAEYKALEADIEKRKADAAAAKKDAELTRDVTLLMTESSVKAALKDPDSAKFGTRQMHANPKAKTGFTVCGYVNAKNSLGGYTGQKGYMVTDGFATIEDGSEKFAEAWKRLCF